MLQEYSPEYTEANGLKHCVYFRKRDFFSYFVLLVLLLVHILPCSMHDNGALEAVKCGGLVCTALCHLRTKAKSG